MLCVVNNEVLVCRQQRTQVRSQVWTCYVLLMSQLPQRLPMDLIKHRTRCMSSRTSCFNFLFNFEVITVYLPPTNVAHNTFSCVCLSWCLWYFESFYLDTSFLVYMYTFRISMSSMYVKVIKVKATDVKSEIQG